MADLFDIGSGRSGSSSVQLEGMDTILIRLQNLPGVAKRALGEAMKVEMEGTIELAKDEYVPRDTGELADSGKVRGPVFTGNGLLEVWGSFGPVENERGSGYAVPVHEIPEPPEKSIGGRSAHHDHGTWHFLTLPFLVREDGALGRIEEEFDVLLGRLGLL